MQTKFANPFYDSISSKGVADVGNMALLSLGVGGAARGLVGLLNTVKRNVRPPEARYPGAIVAKVPYHESADEKRADYGLPDGVFNSQNVTDKTNLPWYYPAMFMTGGLGLAGGWAGVDHVLDKRRRTEQDAELGDAQGEFRKALLGPPRHKAAAEKTAGERLGEALDALYDAAVEKRAILDDVIGKSLGLYGAYAVGTGGLAAMMAYARQRGESDEAILQKAMARRIRRNYQARPSEIFAVPDPVGRRTPAAAPTPPPADAPKVPAPPTPMGDDLDDDQSQPQPADPFAARPRRVDRSILSA
jgi:hypothetical protein